MEAPLPTRTRDGTSHHLSKSHCRGGFSSITRLCQHYLERGIGVICFHQVRKVRATSHSLPDPTLTGKSKGCLLLPDGEWKISYPLHLASCTLAGESDSCCLLLLGRDGRTAPSWASPTAHGGGMSVLPTSSGRSVGSDGGTVKGRRGFSSHYCVIPKMLKSMAADLISTFQFSCA